MSEIPIYGDGGSMPSLFAGMVTDQELVEQGAADMTSQEILRAVALLLKTLNDRGINIMGVLEVLAETIHTGDVNKEQLDDSLEPEE